MSTILLAIIFSIISVIIGGLVTYFSSNKKFNFYINIMLCFGAGFLLVNLFTEFIPYSFKNANSMVSSALIIFGILLAPIIEKIIHAIISRNNSSNHQHCCHSKSSDTHVLNENAAFSTLLCLCVCSFFDGFMLNSSFYISYLVGTMTLVGLLFHNIPSSVLVSSIFLASGQSKFRAFSSCIIFSGSIVLGSFVSFYFGKIEFIPHLLAVSSGILCHLIWTHMFPAIKKTKFGFYYFLLGIAVSSFSSFIIHKLNLHNHAH